MSEVALLLVILIICVTALIPNGGKRSRGFGGYRPVDRNSDVRNTPLRTPPPKGTGSAIWYPPGHKLHVAKKKDKDVVDDV